MAWNNQPKSAKIVLFTSLDFALVCNMYLAKMYVQCSKYLPIYVGTVLRVAKVRM